MYQGLKLAKEKRAIRLLMSEIRSVSVIHAYREANVCADVLANWACDMEYDFLSFEHAPSMMLQWLSSDARGIYNPQLLSS
ncbi:hypothetical protein JHK85_002229 [Glycine max]|nr:hypothetical protein JHK85_002229 [Glycine max]KAG5089561.1 hypothetical protein JHK86_002173 [Glycine max]